jgi:hypothetical protein
VIEKVTENLFKDAIVRDHCPGLDYGKRQVSVLECQIRDHILHHPLFRCGTITQSSEELLRRAAPGNPEPAIQVTL